MKEKIKSISLFGVSILLLLSLLAIFWLAADNGALIEQNNDARGVATEYEASFNRYFAVTSCIDELEQYTYSDNEVVVKVRDIQDCVSKIASASANQ